jgi:hypothetical protein
LCGGFFTALFLEKHVVGGAGVERRVEVDEVDAFCRYLLAEDSEVVAKIELVIPVHFRERISYSGGTGRNREAQVETLVYRWSGFRWHHTGRAQMLAL